MNLVDSIATLERLVAQTDADLLRYVIELCAHRDVKGSCQSTRQHFACDADWALYQTAYAEAQLKQELET